MNTTNLIFGSLAKALEIYTLVIFLRILFNFAFVFTRSVWIFKLGSILGYIVDPFLYFFRRFFPNTGFFDFSPLLAFFILWFFRRLFSTLAYSGSSSLSAILQDVVLFITGMLFWLIIFLVIILLIRWIYRSFQRGYSGILGARLDSFYLNLVNQFLRGRHISSYHWNMVIALCIFLILSFLLFLIHFILIQLIFLIPF